jgi:hypothetical protein
MAQARMTIVGRLGALALALAGLALARAATTHSARAAPTARPVPRVTMITDSVGGVLYWAGTARDELAQGLDLRLETRACRKLVAEGCWAYGERPPSALDTIHALGTELGPLVVIDVGYNDRPDEYAADLDTVMQALLAANVEHVIWVTLEETEEPWIANDEAIREAPRRWPQLVVADWAPVAATNPSWFVDLAHMNYDGAFGFARFLRPIVLAACGPPCQPPPPPPPPPPLRPRTRMLVPVVGTRVAVLRWLGNGAARTFDVAVHPPTGSWRSVASRLAATTYRLRGHRGELLLARVRARDDTGRAGPWTAPQPIRFRRD